MKRKVRIYKDPFGNGGYINKTAQWLRKAQDGAETGATPVTQGIMQQMQSGQPQQAMQQQPEQDPQEQILQTVVALAQQGYGQDEIKDYLLQDIYGFDKASQEYAQYEPQILEFVSAVFERSAPEEEEQEVTDDPIEDIVADTSMQDTSEEDNNYDQMINDIIYDDDDQEARYGGVPNKRSYVNKLVRKLRKAAKGDQVEEANTANVRGTEDNPTGTTGNKNMFVAGVKGQAQDHFLKKQAEEMYNNQFAQEDMDYAQRGGWRMRRANRKMFGSPNLPMGVTSSKYSFGPLGGVRSAEVQFNPLMMASMFPMMTFPGMGGGSSWGYNQPYRKTTKGRLVTEKIASAVNNKSTEDVAKATDSDAATTAAEPKTDVATTNADGTVTVDTSGGTGTAVTPDESSNTGPFEINGARQAMELRNRKDKWGRPMSDKWYGFDPETKKWTLGRTPDWYKEPTKKSRWSNVTMKKDSWGRNEDSKWYGYDPKKKKYTEGPNKGKTTTQVKNKLEDKANKELIEKFGSKVKPYLEYESFQKNANTGERLLNQLGLYGPSDPSLQGGFTGDDDISYIVPGLKGTEAISFALKNQNLLGQGAKGALGAGQKLLNPGQKLLNPGQRLLNPGQGLLEAPAGTQFVLPFAAGGFVNNPMQDQFGNLQKFIYGDQVDDEMLENLFQPPINQSDLDYTDSEDPSDPYFKKHGGLHRFDGTADSETNPKNTGKTYTQEELDKLLTEKQKSWETDYQNKSQQQMQQQMQQYQAMQQYMNPMAYGASGYGFRGSPMGGISSYSPGLLGAAGRFAGSFMGGRQSQYSPVGNPLQYAATAAAITKSGMLPTGMKTSKVKSDDFLGKLGLKKDRITTLSYATPEQIKSGATNTNLSTNPTTSGTTPNDKSRNTDQFGLNKKLNFPGENNRPRLADARINAADRRADRQENRMANRDLRSGDVLKFPGPDMSNMQDMEIPSNIDISKGQTDPRFGYAYGGYIPDYMAYGGDIPMADVGINFSPVSYGANSITQPGGIGQGQTGPCTEEEVKDPNSPCYDPVYAGLGPRVPDTPQTAELQFKEEKGPAGQKAANIMGTALDFGALLADDRDYATERRTKFIPGMTDFAMGEKQSANEVINRGMWGRGGKEGDPQSFKGVKRKGGAIKNKKSNASGHKIDMNDFQSLLKLAGLI